MRSSRDALDSRPARRTVYLALEGTKNVPIIVTNPTTIAAIIGVVVVITTG
jgi:hypothetical protein